MFKVKKYPIKDPKQIAIIIQTLNVAIARMNMADNNASKYRMKDAAPIEEPARVCKSIRRRTRDSDSCKIDKENIAPIVNKKPIVRSIFHQENQTWGMFIPQCK